ncbi:MAG: Gfo/Idh/MocA family oxidoreductase [Pirellulales bacterium]|nr:Gfo/Idh/MocA family oxidoreductase [Pirellulales bacterium]
MNISPGADRREFLHRTGRLGLGLGFGVFSAGSTQRAVAASANEKIVLGIIGIRGRGNQLGESFASRPDVHVAYLADVDRSLFDSRIQSIRQHQEKAPVAVQDFRRVLDDPAVDAVVIATPDHWHALATIWACQAGKHVFVEKPASHTPWEGRKMVEAARKYDRIVQVGLQNRSAAYLLKAKDTIDRGNLGPIHMVRVSNQKYWENTPAVADSPAPAHLDWNMWNGPAPEANYNFNLWENWNHFWRYSGGDIINDAIHQLDLARWLSGQTYPKSVYSVGGRWSEAGVYETPDTQTAVFEFDNMLMNFELTLYTPYMLKTDPELRDSDMFPHWPQNATRIEMYGQKGLMVVGRHGGGWQVFIRPKDRKPVVAAQEYGRFPDHEHQNDFCDAIRNHRRPNADIEEGHRSTFLAQLANISYRLGGAKLQVDSSTESIRNHDEANRMLKRTYRAPWIVPEQV